MTFTPIIRVAPALLALSLSACVASTAPPSESSAPADSSSSEIAQSSVAHSSVVVSSSSADSSMAVSSQSSSVAPNVTPIVEFQSPPANYTFTQGNASYSISALATDEDGTIARVELYVGGDLAETLTVSPWRWSINLLNALAVGDHSLRVAAYDNQGAVVEVERAVTVVAAPNVAPTIAIDSPASDAFLPNGSSIDVEASASDTDGTISQVTLYLNNQVVAVDDSAPYRWPASVLPALQNLATGEYTLRAIAEDDDGATTDDSVTFEVSEPNEFPEIAFAMPAQDLVLPVGTTLDVIAEAIDADGSIAEVRFYVNDMLVGADKNYPYEWFGRSNDETENLATGSYLFKIEAEDDKGGISQEELTVIVQANADANAGDPKRGKLQFLQMCMECHGQFGEGFGQNPLLVPIKNSYNGQTLVDYISDNMPNNFVTNCQDQCARNIATYMEASLQSINDTFKAYVGDAVQGGQEYMEHCASCHGNRGVGNGDLDGVIFPLRDDRSYSLSTFYYYNNSASLFSLIELGMPVGANGYPEGHSDQCEGQCVADVIAYLEDMETTLTGEEQKQIQISNGKRWYEQQCSGCHGADGRSRGIIPLTNAERNNDSYDRNDPLYVENLDRMPRGSVDDCAELCAVEVSVYIREVLDN